MKDAVEQGRQIPSEKPNRRHPSPHVLRAVLSALFRRVLCPARAVVGLGPERNKRGEHPTPRPLPPPPPPPHPPPRHHRAAQHRALPDSTPAASRCPLSMSLHHCRAATTPAMPATGLSSAGASPFRLPASSSSAQGHLRLSPPAASATACRRRLLLRCAASSGGGGGSGSDPVLEEQRRRQAELAARIASGEFTVQGPGSAAAHFPPHPPSFFYHWY